MSLDPKEIPFAEIIGELEGDNVAPAEAEIAFFAADADESPETAAVGPAHLAGGPQPSIANAADPVGREAVAEGQSRRAGDSGAAPELTADYGHPSPTSVFIDPPLMPILLAALMLLFAGLL